MAAQSGARGPQLAHYQVQFGLSDVSSEKVLTKLLQKIFLSDKMLINMYDHSLSIIFHQLGQAIRKP